MNIKMELEKLQQVEEFTYLGAVIANDGSCQKDIRYRSGNASAMFAFRLNKVWKDKQITIQTLKQRINYMKFSLYQYFYMEQNVGHLEKLMKAEYLHQNCDG